MTFKINWGGGEKETEKPVNTISQLDNYCDALLSQLYMCYIMKLDYTKK